MTFIDDIKIGKKLLGGFVLVLLLMIGIACVGYMGLGSATTNADDLYENHMLAAEHLAASNAAIEKYRGNLYRYVYVPSSRTEMKTAMDGLVVTIDKEMAEYSKCDLNAEEQANLAKFNTAFKKMQSGYSQIMKDADANNMEAVTAELDSSSETMKARAEAITGIEWATGKLNTMADDLAKQMDETNNSSIMVMIVISIVAVIIGLGVALYLSKSITSPLEQTVRNLEEMEKGHLGNRLKLNRKDEIGEMADVMDRFSDDLGFIVGTMKRIAVGDLTSNVKAKDDKDEISPALIQMTDAINRMAGEVNMLAKAIDEGKVNTRADMTKHQGDYRKIVEGVNNVCNNFYNPMKEAIRVSGEYAKQDFTARFDDKVKAEGDMVKFKNALNQVGDSVSKALSSISQQVGDLAANAEEANASVEEVSAGSAQVAKNASGVSVNAEKATQGVEQVQKAMEDLSRTIQDVATKSEAVAKIVQDTTTFSREGMELAQKTEQGMQGITRSSNDVNQIIGEIKGQMDKISEIVNLITDLANQTNLLALNAAIEAARAGDAGRGFAVVATEVKSLAVESRASAERIAEMIDNLQRQTQNAVDAVTSSNNGVREGSAALQETLTSFNKIVDAIDKISQNVSDVAAAAEEQAASVEEVTASVNEVGGLMHNTTKEATDAAAASEEASAAIDQISKVVANVNTIVDKVTKEVSQFRI
jgi:methyl-accepting chemotaxis protein